MPLRPIARLLRPVLDRCGYVLIKREYARYGLSLFTDLMRISAVWGDSIATVFDVGANAGQFAAGALRELADARIYSFEPHPATFNRLNAALSSSRLHKYQLALGDRTGHVDFYVYGDVGEGSHLNSLVENARFPTKFGYTPDKITVPGTKLDSFCEEQKIDKIDLLKIDVEGGELAVLRGAADMLRQRRVRFIYAEFNTLLPEKEVAGGALFPIAEYLKQFGFEYLVTYTDYVFHQEEIAVCANALFCAPPDSARSKRGTS